MDYIFVLDQFFLKLDIFIISVNKTNILVQNEDKEIDYSKLNNLNHRKLKFLNMTNMQVNT
jgi:hypothetical protein